MQLLSFGSLYIGIESDKYCDLQLHVGNLTVDYKCPVNQQSNDELRPEQGSDRLSDSETGSSN